MVGSGAGGPGATGGAERVGPGNLGVGGVVAGALVPEDGVCVTTGFALDFALICFLWEGRNWARVLAQLIGALSMLAIGVFFLPPALAVHIDKAVKVKALFETSLGLASLVVLNLRDVKTFFFERITR